MAFTLPAGCNDIHGHRTSGEDGCVLLDLAHNRFLKLNPVAAAIWQRLRAHEPEPAIVRALAARYGVEEARVARDVTALRHQMTVLGVASEPATASPRLARHAADSIPQGRWEILRSGAALDWAEMHGAAHPRLSGGKSADRDRPASRCARQPVSVRGPHAAAPREESDAPVHRDDP